LFHVKISQWEALGIGKWKWELTVGFEAGEDVIRIVHYFGSIMQTAWRKDTLEASEPIRGTLARL
jgi:hypothetical protein